MLSVERWALIALTVIIAAIAAYVLLRKEAPKEAATLPERIVEQETIDTVPLKPKKEKALKKGLDAGTPHIIVPKIPTYKRQHLSEPIQPRAPKKVDPPKIRRLK